nr:hypothetical protein B0A51_12421 [Rachicladosporium sp. CCFEE 5018]
MSTEEGQRRIDRNRVYTRSHIELLERQRWQLVAGIREIYKRLQQADALPTAASNNHSETLDIHSVLRSLGVVHEDCDEDMDYDETSDDIGDMHRDQVDGESMSGSMDSAHASISERGLSPASSASYGIFGDASMQATDSTLMPEFLGVVSPKASNRSLNLVQSPPLQALPSPWKFSLNKEELATVVMPTSVWRAKAAEYAASAGRPFRVELPPCAMRRSCSSQDTLSPLEPPSYFWPALMVADAYGTIPLPNSGWPHIAC